MQITDPQVMIDGKEIEFSDFCYSELRATGRYRLKKDKEGIEYFNQLKANNFEIDSFSAREGDFEIISGKGKIEVLNETDDHYELLISEYS